MREVRGEREGKQQGKLRRAIEQQRIGIREREGKGEGNTEAR